MRHKLLLSALIVASAFLSNAAELDNTFKNPADVTTSAYWYWISDNISKDGIIKDLNAMKEQGINRAFIGNIGLGDIPPKGDVKFRSEEWWDAMHLALKTATELGIEIGIFNSPGWSQSGGPWVTPDQSMRFLQTIRKDVEGGKDKEIEIYVPSGFRDVAVLAFPNPDAKGKSLTNRNASVKITPECKNPECIFDGDISTEVDFGAPENDRVEVVFSTKEDFTLRSLTMNFGGVPVNCPARLYAVINGEDRLLASFQADRYNFSPDKGFDILAPIVIAVEPIKANEFKIVFDSVNHGVKVGEIRLSEVPKLERYAEKSLAKMYQGDAPEWSEYLWNVQAASNNPGLMLNPEDILDITDLRDNDKILWEAPEGNWTILRMGMMTTGSRNGPAHPDASGLEIDKMSKRHVESHFDNYMGEFLRRIPEADRKSWKVVVQDSYEKGGQNFTDDFVEEFSERYGYEMSPFLPVLSGFVVGDEDSSERFLWDLRRMVADKISYDYVGGLRDVCHKYGLTTWLENYGHWGYPGEFLQYGGQSDEIAGEFWVEGALGDTENRAASSCGHIYGKTKIASESFTSADKEYERYPYIYKKRGDFFFSEGINDTLLHLYTHQPYEDRNPGVNAWFGSEFNRKNTWYPHLGLFNNYLKRANLMLQQGLNVADVAYFIGEDAPKMTGATNPPLPKGYQFDYMNAEVIEKFMGAKDNMLTLPHGTQYKLMVLPPLETMRPELLAKIKELVEAGGVIMGNPPSRSPSFENYPECDELVKELAGAMWEGLDGENVKYKKYGRGYILRNMTMQEAFDLLQCPPDVKLAEHDPVVYGHRKSEWGDIYFISNQSESEILIEPEFRITGKQPELWDAVHGTMRDLKSFKFGKTGTVVPLKLAPLESAFIVFKKDVESSAELDVSANFPAPKTVSEVGRWSLSFEGMKAPNPINELKELKDISTFDDFDTRHFSGIIKYAGAFNLNDVKGGIFVDLGKVGVTAKVKINGKYAGGAWTYPYRVDITDFVKNGENRLEVEVATTWFNRIIGDLNLPKEERLTWVPVFNKDKDAKLQESGLLGPVKIQSISY